MGVLKLGAVFFTLVVWVSGSPLHHFPHPAVYTPQIFAPIFDAYPPANPAPPPPQPHVNKSKPPQTYKPLLIVKPESNKPKDDYKPVAKPDLHKPDPYQPAPSAHQPVLPYKPVFTYKPDVDDYEENLKSYSFDYGVNDDYTGSHFGHKEKSDGKEVKGTYSVALPDGRIQTVKYKADHENGFQAEVSYERQPIYPYKPAAAPIPAYPKPAAAPIPAYPKPAVAPIPAYHKPAVAPFPVYPKPAVAPFPVYPKPAPPSPPSYKPKPVYKPVSRPPPPTSYPSKNYYKPSPPPPPPPPPQSYHPLPFYPTDSVYKPIYEYEPAYPYF